MLTQLQRDTIKSLLSDVNYWSPNYRQIGKEASVDERTVKKMVTRYRENSGLKIVIEWFDQYKNEGDPHG